mmetsp:Transcript_93578/g.267739  ORF Transcript_93578/g.267739 Transcript_93578/m.267739 type:complete len:588 (-) Transcript_93578:70-1833(-)
MAVCASPKWRSCTRRAGIRPTMTTSLVIPIIGAFAVRNRSLARTLHRPLVKTKLAPELLHSTGLHEMTHGDFQAIMWYFGLNIAWMISYAERHSMGWKHATGVCSICNLIFTALPVTKTSIWLWLVGLSYERAIKFHRYLARYTLTIMLIHAYLELTTWGMDKIFSWEKIGHVTPMAGVMAWATFVLMGASGYHLIRRKKYEVFRYLHSLFAVGLVFVFMHTPASRYLLPVIALSMIDYGFRWYRCWKYQALKVIHATALTLGPADTPVRWTQLTLGVTDPRQKARRMVYGPGDWAMVCIPEISMFEWHPFSISSSPGEAGSGVGVGRADGADGADGAGGAGGGKGESTISFTIKDMGPGTWTAKLHQLVGAELSKDGEDQAQGQGKGGGGGGSSTVNPEGVNVNILPGIHVLLDGPYGKLSIALDQYESLVMVAGGIGITPIASLLGYIASAKGVGRFKSLVRLHVVWVAKYRGEINVFDALLARVQSLDSSFGEASGMQVTLSLFASREARTADGTAGGGEAPAGTFHVRMGERPAVGALVSEAVRAAGASTTAVLACGPAAVVDDARDVAYTEGCGFHSECFLL